MLLTKEQAQALEVPVTIWRELSGGYEGTRYRAEKMVATVNDDDKMLFGGSGYAWSGYNRSVCGWRLWTEEPTDDERLSARWIVT